MEGIRKERKYNNNEACLLLDLLHIIVWFGSAIIRDQNSLPRLKLRSLIDATKLQDSKVTATRLVR